MNPFSPQTEQREFMQQYYGGYCNRARAEGLTPIRYVHFQESLKNLIYEGVTNKEVMRALIDETILVKERLT